ncbi:hypothetical protein HLBS07_38460 [Vibrio alginolyticus]|nr:hypothetical protein HLBS07_38460 [Vibrio alginolyticus]
MNTSLVPKAVRSKISTRIGQANATMDIRWLMFWLLGMLVTFPTTKNCLTIFVKQFKNSDSNEARYEVVI